MRNPLLNSLFLLSTYSEILNENDFDDIIKDL